MTNLSVNLNKVALLRNQRTLGIPSVVEAARTCIEAGAHGITVHPRPDERHIRRGDVYDLAAMLTVEFNIEGNPFEQLVELVRDVRPEQATLVPDSPDQATSDHGWDLARDGARLEPIVRELHEIGVRVSLFMDPVPENMAAAARIGADRVELYTEAYARGFSGGKPDAATAPYRDSALAAREAGLGVNAGHDLNLENVGPFLRAVPDVLEVSIGHALTAEALFMGLGNTVREYVRILAEAGGGER